MGLEAPSKGTAGSYNQACWIAVILRSSAIIRLAVLGLLFGRDNWSVCPDGFLDKHQLHRISSSLEWEHY